MSAMSLFKKLKGFLYKPYGVLFRFSIHLFKHLPIDNRKIVLVHDFGNGYGDSPKYVAEELLRRSGKYKIVWLVNSWDLDIPKPIRKVNIFRIRSVYELSTAKVIVTTMKGRSNFVKRPEQFFIYIPHGQIGAKYVEGQAKCLGQSYIENSKWHSSVSDLFLSSSKLFTEEVRKYYWYNGEIMECGLPRNDIFFNYKKEDIERIKDGLNIKANVGVLFYAPTFRESADNSAYAIDTGMLLDALEKKTQKRWVLLIRLHPCFVWYGKPVFNYSDRVVDVTSYPDIQELLLVSDILISDYSSTMFDFFLMRKPVFLFVKDMEEYQRIRGLKDWYFRVPFPFCHNNQELKEAIENYDEEKYKNASTEFAKLYGSMEHGTATKAIVDKICQYLCI